MLTVLLEHSNRIIIHLSTDFSILQLSRVASDFYNWQKAEGENFLELCKSYNYTSPINNNYFQYPNPYNGSVTTDSYGCKYKINWVIHPLKMSDGKTTGVVLIGKIIELQKNDIANHFNEFINCIPGCLYWKDCNGYYQGCNQLTADLAGLKSAEDIMGKTDRELWGGQADWLTGNDKVVISTGKTVVVEEKLQAADGQWLYFTGVKMPIKDEEGNITGIIGNSLDITELKNVQTELKRAKEKAENISKAKSEFIANMSHDVRTPLSGIIGVSKILLTMLKGEEYDLIQTMELSAQQLMNFFNNCINIAKSEMSDIVLVKEHFNLKILLEEITDLFTTAALSKNLEFNVNYDNSIPSSLLGNRVGVYRILLNLVGNAFKFTEKGNVSIAVKLSKKSTDKNIVVRLIVEDTGIGIPKDKQKIIFENFTRLIPSYQGVYEGSGIGLHLVDKLIKAMQGEIYVNSEAGKGSQFIVELPLEIALLDETENKVDDLNFLASQTANEKKEQGIKQVKYAERDIVTSRINVLLVEDSLLAQKVTYLILAPYISQIDIAESGERALTLFEPGKYDLVLMDIGLPDIQGYDVSTMFREKENNTEYHVPIIALTAHGDDALRETYLRSGMEDFFIKPFSSQQLDIIFKHYIFKKT